jgi:hypothetical protein
MNPPAPDEVRAGLVRLLEDRANWYAGAVLTIVAERESEGDGWLNLLTTLEWVKDTMAIVPLAYLYPDIRILRRVMNISESRKMLDRLTINRHVGIDEADTHVRFASALSAVLPIRRLQSEWSRWPVDLFDSIPSVAPALPRFGHLPLVALASPLFPSLGEVLSTLFGIANPSWSNYFRGQVTLVVPDTRARISDLTIHDHRLTVALELSEARLDDVVVKLFVHAKERRPDQVEVVPSGSTVEFDVPDSSHGVYAALLCRRTGETLGYRGLNADVRVEQPFELFDEATVSRLAARGEDDEIEYKEWKPRPESFAKDVVAFANTRGGVILLGVNDEGSILGQLVHDQTDWVADVLANYTEPPVRSLSHKVFVAQRQVLVIEVRKSGQVHTLRDRGPIVRFGGTSRSPSKNELDALYRGGMDATLLG